MLDPAELALERADPAAQRIALRGQADICAWVVSGQSLPVNLTKALGFRGGDEQKLLEVLPVFFPLPQSLHCRGSTLLGDLLGSCLEIAVGLVLPSREYLLDLR